MWPIRHAGLARELVLMLTTVKQCTFCQQELPIGLYRRWTGSEDGHLAVCFDCESLNERLGNYHLTIKQFFEMLEAQGWKCPVCGKALTVLTAAIDHDHRCCNRDGSCGKCVRGLLDRDCNAGLGLLGDEVSRLQAGALYLIRWEARPAPL